MYSADYSLINSLRKLRACILMQQEDLVEVNFSTFLRCEMLGVLLDHTEKMQEVIDSLGDDESKTVFLQNIEMCLLASALSADLSALLLHDPIMPLLHWKELLLDAETLPDSYGMLPQEMAQHHLLNMYNLPGICTVEEGEHLIDVGAGSGISTKHFAAQCGKRGNIYALEGDPKRAEILRAATASWPNVHVTTAALGDIQGEWAKGGRVLPLDDFILEQSIKTIGTIKIKAGGSELGILRGSLQTLKEYRPKLIIHIDGEAARSMLSIPMFIKNINVGYTIYMRKFSAYLNDTILFCVP